MQNPRWVPNRRCHDGIEAYNGEMTVKQDQHTQHQTANCRTQPHVSPGNPVDIPLKKMDEINVDMLLVTGEDHHPYSEQPRINDADSAVLLDARNGAKKTDAYRGQQGG